MRVLAICGSLRAESSNIGLLRAAAAVAPGGMEFVVYEGLERLPQFNPDLDELDAVAPPAVTELRALAASAAGFVFSTPEYAHGLPGALKNALDWLVSSGELIDKPVLVLNASPNSGQFAQAQLAETLRMLSARVLDASRLQPFLARKPAADGSGLDDAALKMLRSSLAALAQELASGVA